jgi:hypothetical protein
MDEISGRPGVLVMLMHVNVAREGFVYAGNFIGTARMMGNATNDVLHLEVHIGGGPQNPTEYLIFPPGTRLNYTDPATGTAYLIYVPPYKIQQRFSILGEENPWGGG